MSTATLDFHPTLDLLATGAIGASVESLIAEDRLTIAIRDALKNGADINDVSGITGLTVAEIQKRMDRNLNVLSEDALLAVA